MSLNEPHYQTSDFPTVCTLLLRKHPLVDVIRTDPRRVVFLFGETDALKEDLSLLQSGQLAVDPFDFWAAQRRCKALLHEEAGV